MKKDIKILLTGGGSGGHITPNLVIIDELKIALPKVDILYVGKRNKWEKAFIERENIKFTGIFCGRLRRYLSIKSLWDFIQIPVGILQSLWILMNFKPDIIFAKGGYVSFPVCLAAKIMRIPYVIHESDLSPGLANKMSAKWADKICVAWEETGKFFEKEKVLVTGNPVRDVTKGSSSLGEKLLGLKKTKSVILFLGGGQGDDDLNNLVLKEKKELLKKWQVVHLCGPGKERPFVRENNENYRALASVNAHEMRDLYAMVDVIVTRAGALTLAEIAQLDVGKVLLPLSKKCSRGDQIENAELFAKKHPETSIAMDCDFDVATLERVHASKNKTQKELSAAKKIVLLLKTYL